MKINIEKLTNSEYFQKIKEEVDIVIFEDRFLEAFRLARDLEKALITKKEIKNSNKILYNEYWKIIDMLKWIGVQIVTPEGLRELLEYKFTKIYKIPDLNYTELWRKISVVLLGVLILDKRDEVKVNLRKALLDNKEFVTKSDILVNGIVVKPTVGNWLKDYNILLGIAVVEKIKRTQYLTNSKNINKVSQEERKKLRLLFDLYERLKKSSYTLEGLEEEIPIDEPGFTGIVKEGVFEPFKESVEDKKMKKINNEDNNQIEELKKMVDQYPEGSLERMAVEEELNKLKSANK